MSWESVKHMIEYSISIAKEAIERENLLRKIKKLPNNADQIIAYLELCKPSHCAYTFEIESDLRMNRSVIYKTMKKLRKKKLIKIKKHESYPASNIWCLDMEELEILREKGLVPKRWDSG